MKRCIFAVLVLAALAVSCGTIKKSAGSGDSAAAGRQEISDFMRDNKVEVERTMINKSTYLVSEFTSDKTYGYTEENPVKVGGVSEGPANERRFLNALTGPNGEKISYERQGSCCPFKTDKGMFGMGLLDIYTVWYEDGDTGVTVEKTILINMYDADELKVPVGFGSKGFPGKVIQE